MINQIAEFCMLYEIGNRMLYNVMNCVLLPNRKLYVLLVCVLHELLWYELVCCTSRYGTSWYVVRVVMVWVYVSKSVLLLPRLPVTDATKWCVVMVFFSNVETNLLVCSYGWCDMAFTMWYVIRVGMLYELVYCTSWYVVRVGMLYKLVCYTSWYVVMLLSLVCYTSWYVVWIGMLYELVCCTSWYDIGDRMLYNVGCRMLLRNLKSYVVWCGMSYVVMKLEIECCTMWDVVFCYEIGNHMLYHVGSRLLSRNWKSYVVPCEKSYVVMKLEIVCCTMWEVVCCYEFSVIPNK